MEIMAGGEPACGVAEHCGRPDDNVGMLRGSDRSGGLSIAKLFYRFTLVSMYRHLEGRIAPVVELFDRR